MNATYRLEDFTKVADGLFCLGLLMREDSHGASHTL